MGTVRRPQPRCGAGTGFRTYQESEVRIRPEALQQIAAEKSNLLEREFPLLHAAESQNGGDGAKKTPAETAATLAEMFRGTETPPGS